MSYLFHSYTNIPKKVMKYIQDYEFGYFEAI